MTQSVFMWQNIIHNQKWKCQQGQQATGPSPVMTLQAFSSLLACRDRSPRLHSGPTVQKASHES